MLGDNPAALAFPSWSFDDKGDPYLIGTKCRLCEAFHFPPSQTCRNCLAEDMEETHFGREGTLYSFSVIHVPSPGFEAPYAIGYVDLDHRTRLYTLLSDWERRDLKDGMKMELAINTIKENEDGTDVKGYTFRPKKDAQNMGAK